MRYVLIALLLTSCGHKPDPRWNSIQSICDAVYEAKDGKAC